MLSSRLFIGLLIPLIFLGFCIWVVATTEVNRNDVRVAGAQIGTSDVEIVVNDCNLVDDQGVRKLVVELDARNISGITTNISPFDFQLALTQKSNPIGTGGKGRIFTPIYSRSICDSAPESSASIPPDAVRSYTLHFLGANLPYGDAWDDYYLNLEYYGNNAELLISKPLNPEGK